MNISSPGNGMYSRRQSGFSIIELMIGMTIGLLILAGLITVFVQSSQARTEIERSNRQIESGRYAVSLLTEDLRLAGYFGTFDPYMSIIKPNSPPLGGATPMTSMPDPCNATLSGNASSWINSFFVHIQGVNNVTSTSTPSCLSDVKAGTDIVVVRRQSTCVAGPTAGTSCDGVLSGVPYFQASNCYNSLELAKNSGSTAATDYLSYFNLDTNTSTLTNATTGRHTLNCSGTANFSRYLVRIYFVANNNVAGDNIPTLKRAELGAGGFTIVPLVEGIENLQLEYGVDYVKSTVTNQFDGVIDGYTADPGTLSGCVGNDCVFNWLRTYAVKVNVLARNTSPTQAYVDTKTYNLGLLANGTANAFGPFNDAYKRHVYNSIVRLDNPAGRALP